jgi:hypothetical protein
MRDLFQIKVESHSGYKADEHPKCFYWREDKYTIIKILDRWYQGSMDPEWPIGNYFKVITEDDRKFIIKHDLEADEWYLICR